MKFRHVAKINYADGSDPMYYIDGEKQDDIYSDDQLLGTLLGKSFQVFWLKDDAELDSDDLEALWSTSHFDELQELVDYLNQHPELVEET